MHDNDVHPSEIRMRILLAAGGTGGHIFPAEALAEALLAQGHEAELISDARFAAYYAGQKQSVFSRIPVHTIATVKPSGGVVGKAVAAVFMLRSLLQAVVMIGKLRPDMVVGFGGYPSFPSVMAASLLGFSTMIHEQNAVLGRANRVLARRVKTIAATYAAMQHLPKGCEAKVHPVGNPVRAGIAALRQMAYPAPQEGGLLRILITGGSQGANVFSDVVPAAIGLLPEALRMRLRIDQQCRPERIDAVREAYQVQGVQADLGTFFTDIPARLAAAHLVIGRSGASTVAELSVAGRPAILVPYPAATDDHQFYNAQSAAEAGAAWVMRQADFTPQAVAERLKTLLEASATLVQAAEKMRALGMPDATAKLAELATQRS